MHVMCSTRRGGGSGGARTCCSAQGPQKSAKMQSSTYASLPRRQRPSRPLRLRTLDRCVVVQVEIECDV